MSESIYYVLNSSTTHRTFIAEDMKCFVSTSPNGLEPFMVEHPGTEIGSARCLEETELHAAMYACGADVIVFVDGKETKEVPLTSRTLKLAPYNHALNGRLSLFKETKKKRYLRDMLKCEFIVPAKIVDGTKILYGVAQHKVVDLPILYIAFSDLEEFDTWLQPGMVWQPLRINYKGLQKILGGNVGIMLNPAGNRLVISRSMLESVLTEDTEKRKEEVG